jgi:hypothetical protein
MTGFATPVVGDVAVTCPHPVSSSTRFSLSDARKVERAAEAYRKIKEDKYDGPCTFNGLKFVPLIFESTGRMS